MVTKVLFDAFRSVMVAAIDLRRNGDEETLLESEERLRQVIDLIPHFVFAKDMDGKFLLANTAVAEVYGTTPENLIGKSDYDYNPNIIMYA